MHKKVTISLSPELHERWNNVVKKHNLVKSVMVQNFLNEIVTRLENEKPNMYIDTIVSEMQKEKEKSLFEDV